MATNAPARRIDLGDGLVSSDKPMPVKVITTVDGETVAIPVTLEYAQRDLSHQQRVEALLEEILIHIRSISQ